MTSMNAIPLSFTTSLSKWDCARYVWESDDPMTDGLLGRLISYLEEKGLVNIKPEIDAADAAALHKDTEYRKSEYLEAITGVRL